MTNIHRGSENILVKTLAAGSLSTGATSTSIDTLGYSKATFVLAATTGSSSNVTVQPQDSADDSTFTAVSGGTSTEIGASVTTEALVDVDLTYRNRYLNAKLTVTGTVTGAVIVLLFNAKDAPPIQDNAAVSV
jgi:hypothetical protein